MLEEVGEPFERILLNMEAQEHKQAEYLAINPMGRVPALRHGESIITETAAICTYLAEAFPAAGLSIPIGSPFRADYLRWLFFAPVSAEPAIIWKSLDNVKSDIDYKPFSEVDVVASTLQSVLRGREFIVGDHFTAATS
jgi:glutathione S-transferase